jgi:uncharacterized membrane-anchored protein
MRTEWQPDMDRPFRRFLSKVPEVPVWFWIKILATAVGETFADFLSVNLGRRLRFGLRSIVAFWLAYVVTRPLGDLLSQPADAGGLGLGTVATTGVFLAAIVGVVVFLTRTRRDAPALFQDWALL